ncbi:feruloyl esterase [Lentzea sp. NBRC 105346]|uniref:tannase/feruloyl esterase family alpha/beta hydrolase n=1 Tax=Lentzea sp. NBRC 105346 TaxID=3032205 RepID=UPI0024A057BD|nr:tannase/feruloyl esterase family alpha/beta hydrolase [Lentzea sp. NBRC 105346]GLZ30036.1 feruloyl esterase [Lentzea sp. NBRC 105346]
MRQCADLVRDFDIPNAKTHVKSAVVVPKGAEAEHCDVRGTIEPDIGFQVKLPVSTYQGRYLQYGCGGFCGILFPAPFPNCGPGSGDAAVAVTNDGHQAPDQFGFDTTWAKTNQAARDDYFYRAPHVVSKAAKQLITTYYGTAPRKSYFNGCSNGGREALLLAQRYPDDFDGIIAAAPGNYFGPLVAYQAWLARHAIPDAKLTPLHNAVMAACDTLDGLADNQIDDPRRCSYDPAKLLCADADQASCLTQPEVDNVRALYAGPTDEHGKRLYPGGEPYGGELAWAGWVTPIPEFGGSISALLADNALRNLTYPIGKPHSSLQDFKFTVPELRRLEPELVKANALSLDLRRFQRSGGKLILWHGASDEAIPFAGTLDYWQRLTHGLPQNWARLFVVPTMYHCQGGSALTDFDPTAALVAWVERGTTPSRIIAEGRDAQGNVKRTRPVFPYPLTARYDGTGSIDDASNFLPYRPSVSNDKIHWAGENLYYKPGPVAP